MGQVSSCANALKAFFRELREPAFNTTSYADIIQLMDEGASYNRKSLKLEQNPFLSPFAAESLFGVKGRGESTAAHQRPREGTIARGLQGTCSSIGFDFDLNLQTHHAPRSCPPCPPPLWSISHAGKADDAEKIAAIKVILTEHIDGRNLTLLRILFFFIAEVGSHHEKNGMTCKNLAIVFGTYQSPFVHA